MQWPEWLVRAWEPVQPYAEKLAVWRGYEPQLQTLVLFAIGIALYAAFVFAFYQNISKRDAWHSKRQPGFGGWLLDKAQLWLVFPMMSFIYFALLAGSLFLLAKSQAVGQIFLIAMSVVVGVRVVAYASEGAAADLAKLLPLGLLGVLIVDPSQIKWGDVLARFREVPSQMPLLGRYFLLFLVLETALRWMRGVATRIGERTNLKRASGPLTRAGLVPPVAAAPARRVPVKGGAKPREGPAAGEDLAEIE